jgi:hypothetical protein
MDSVQFALERVRRTLNVEELMAAGEILACEVERLRAIEARAVEMAEFVLPPDDKDYDRATTEADVAAMILERTPAYLAEVGERLAAARRREDPS